MGTIGVAGMGIGLSMGIPAPIIAGAVISGSYFGDKMSPLSDTTNLAIAGLTNTDLFVHIRHMLFTTVPGVIITLTVYGFLGMKYRGSNIDQESIEQVIVMLEKSFVISPLVLINYRVIVIALVVKNVQTIPALVIGIVFGSVAQVFVQGGSLAEAIGALQSGFVIETGNEMVDGLFNRGGLDSMMYTVSMTIVAMTFGEYWSIPECFNLL